MLFFTNFERYPNKFLNLEEGPKVELIIRNIYDIKKVYKELRKRISR